MSSMFFFFCRAEHQEDHQLSSHTETYQHIKHHQTVIYVFTKPKMAFSREATSEENKCLVEVEAAELVSQEQVADSTQQCFIQHLNEQINENGTTQLHWNNLIRIDV